MVTTIRLGRRDVHAGDRVRVRPSKPRKRDGFVARFVGAEVVDDGLKWIQVFGAPPRRPPCMRHLPPERVSGMRQVT